MSADALHIKNDIMRIVADTNDTTVLEQIREFLEDLEDIRLHDEGMAGDDPGIPYDEAIKMIEAAHKELT